MSEVNEVIKEPVKCKLFKDDLMKIGKELAEETQERNQLDARRREVASTLAAQMKAHETRIAELTAKIMQGYEVRDIECMWLMDTPRTGMKTMVRKDNNEEIRTETMSQADAQLGMDLQPPTEEPPAEDDEKE